jgi:hypothetical protein
VLLDSNWGHRAIGQYVSLAFGRAARQTGIAVSMGARGDACDNTVAETIFATLKKELVNRRSWPSRLELRRSWPSRLEFQSAVIEYMEASTTAGAATPRSAWSPRLIRSRPTMEKSNQSNKQRPKQPRVSS